MDRLISLDHGQGLSVRFSAAGRTLALILAALALRFVFAAITGLGVDESYTVATSRAFALSAFDHPPLAWWMAHAAAALFGEHDFLLRMPFVLMFALTTWLMFALTRRLYGDEAGFYAALALNLSPVLGVVDGSWILPDSPLLPSLLACGYALVRAFFDQDSRRTPWWMLLAGICAGLALLSKYHGVFLFFGAGLFMLTVRSRRFWLATPWPYAAALLAALVFTPVLVWNADHHWVSFLFELNRTGHAKFQPFMPLLLLALHSLWLAPWIFLPLAALIVRTARRGPAAEKDWLLFCLGIGPIVFFTLVSIYSSRRVYPHWAMPGYLFFFPLLGREIADRLARGARWLRLGLIAAIAVIPVGMAFAATLPYRPIPGLGLLRHPMFELLDWNGFDRYLAENRLNRPYTFIAAKRWLYAGKLDYALHGARPVLCLCHDPRGYGVIRDPKKYIGWDAVIVAPNMTLFDAKVRYGFYFDSIEPLPPFVLMEDGRKTFGMNVFLAKNFQHPAPEFSLHRQSEGDAFDADRARLFGPSPPDDGR